MKAVLLSVVGLLAADQLAPPAGDYRIDSETTTTARAGGMLLRTVQRVDGATGDTTVTRFGPAGPPSTETYPGQGPNHWCVKGASAPPPVAANCANQRFDAVAGGGSVHEAICGGGLTISTAFHRQADGRWERTFQTSAAPAAPVDPRTTAAMAPVIAQIEETIRTGPPAEAEAAKQQLAALKSSLGGGAGNGQTVSVRETWTKVSERCG